MFPRSHVLSSTLICATLSPCLSLSLDWPFLWPFKFSVRDMRWYKSFTLSANSSRLSSCLPALTLKVNEQHHDGRRTWNCGCRFKFWAFHSRNSFIYLYMYYLYISSLSGPSVCLSGSPRPNVNYYCVFFPPALLKNLNLEVLAAFSNNGHVDRHWTPFTYELRKRPIKKVFNSFETP